MNTSVAIVYANLKSNLGDFAILHAMLLDIRSKHPDCTVDVYSHGFVSVDHKRLSAFRKSAPAFELVGTTYADNVRLGGLAKRVLKLTRLAPSYQRYRIAKLAKKAASTAVTFSRYKAIYLAGGAHWTGEYQAVSMYATLRAISAHNDQIFSYPISVRASLGRGINDRRTVCQDLGRIRGPIVVRDSSSEMILKRLDLNAVLGSDCVFSLAREGERVPPMPHSTRSRILLVVTNQDLGELKSVVARLASAGIPLALLSTCEIEDAPPHKPIADAAGIDLLLPVTWQEVVAEMKASALVVTNRLHGLILASFSSVPVLPLTDRSKVEAVVEDMGLPLSISDLGSLNEAIVCEVMDRSEEIVGIIASYRDRAQDEALAPIF